jgi:hypothetical protein
MHPAFSYKINYSTMCYMNANGGAARANLHKWQPPHRPPRLPGSGITDNLADKARKLGIPLFDFRHTTAMRGGA